MAKQARVKQDWSKTNGALLATRIKGVGEAMTDNTDFENPAVAPADMIEQADSANTAYNNRKNGPVGRAAYKAVLADSLAMMKKQADYVSETADGNLKIIASADYNPTATSSRKKVVPQSPQPPKLKNENGKLRLTLQRVKGASSYCYLVFIGELKSASVIKSQINIDPQSNVIIIPAGTTRESIRGLASGTRVWVMALAQNAAGKSAFSSAVTICIA